MKLFLKDVTVEDMKNDGVVLEVPGEPERLEGLDFSRLAMADDRGRTRPLSDEEERELDAAFGRWATLQTAKFLAKLIR